jgi:hypothetical protein
MATNPSTTPRLKTFHVSCWALGVIAFAEIMTAAVALAARLETSRAGNVVEKIVEVPKLVEVRVPVPVKEERPPFEGLVSRPPIDEAPAFTREGPEPSPITTPPIHDPEAEKLVNEARSARVAEDMGAAIIKLQEAAGRIPDDPNVEYELGLVHETMENFSKAAIHYENVFRMGATKAGALYELAAGKLRDGLKPPDPVGKFALGRVRIFKDVDYAEGERVVITVPLQKAPDFKADPKDFTVNVKFYNLAGEEVVEAIQGHQHSSEWVTLPIDWAGGEELTRVTYVIPHQDEQDIHLFGKRTYYGQTVTLTYKNKVVDFQAWPRDLAARSQAPAAPVQQFPGGLPGIDDIPPEFLNTEDFGGVLPPLDPPR